MSQKIKWIAASVLALLAIGAGIMSFRATPAVEPLDPATLDKWMRESEIAYREAIKDLQGSTVEKVNSKTKFIRFHALDTFENRGLPYELVYEFKKSEITDDPKARAEIRNKIAEWVALKKGYHEARAERMMSSESVLWDSIDAMGLPDRLEVPLRKMGFVPHSAEWKRLYAEIIEWAKEEDRLQKEHRAKEEIRIKEDELKYNIPKYSYKPPPDLKYHVLWGRYEDHYDEENAQETLRILTGYLENEKIELQKIELQKLKPTRESVTREMTYQWHVDIFASMFDGGDLIKAKIYQKKTEPAASSQDKSEFRPVSFDDFVKWLVVNLKYSYFHPQEKRFKIDYDARAAGVPSKEYRKTHPWGLNEGPNITDPKKVPRSPGE